jgi:BCD family chlorophyll transporter-like MFS transporter
MLLAGMVASALIFGALLHDFSQIQLIQIIQGAALATFILNGIALWKQEARNPALTKPDRPRTSFAQAWQEFSRAGRSRRLLVAAGLGTAGFSMQDILLEPYGGQIFGLSVGQTTALTAILAGGTLAGFALAARQLGRGGDPHRIAAFGLLAGVGAFAAVIFASALDSAGLFRTGTAFIGFGSGLFAVGMLTAAMDLASNGMSGLALGAWGAVQATAAGTAIAASGSIRDAVSALAESGALGPALSGPETGYSFVYHLEIVLLFATLVALGPLVRTRTIRETGPAAKFGLAEYPG